MRLFITPLLLLIFVLIAGLPASAAGKRGNASPGHGRATDVALWGPAKEQKFLLSGGYSSDFKYEGYLGVKGAFDYLISQSFSAGVEANLYFGNTTFRYDRTPSAGMRASYHFLPVRRSRNNPWNLYSGLNAGADFGGGNKPVDEVDPYLDAHVGARYLITENWLLLGELSSRNATIGLSLRF